MLKRKRSVIRKEEPSTRRGSSGPLSPFASCLSPDLPLSPGFMVDIHAHILPGFDDGAQTFAEALEMARQAADDGIKTIIATPHIIYPDRPHREKILLAVAALREYLAAEGVAIEILPGAEVHIAPDLGRLALARQVMTLCDAGRYLLLELPLGELPLFTEEVVFDLLTAGLTPIIAHPERNRDLAREPRLLRKLVDRGCLAQVSTGSVRGRFGREAQRAARRMLADGLIHFMASDGHGAERRRVLMAEARERVAEWCGVQTARALTSINPRMVAAGPEMGAAIRA